MLHVEHVEPACSGNDGSDDIFRAQSSSEHTKKHFLQDLNNFFL